MPSSASLPTAPTVLVTEGSDPAPLAWLRQRANVIECVQSDPAFPDALRNADALIVRTYTRVDANVLASAPRLRVVGRGGVGLENIDVAACRARNVQVVYTPDANTHAVADFCIGYMLQLLRPWRLFGERSYPADEFKRIRGSVRGSQLDELTLGLLGMGRVGRRLGRIAAAGFGMRVLYNDLIDVRHAVDFKADPVDKDRLFHESDVLSIHVDMRPANRHLVAAPQLAQMRPGAILINTSRGEVLDVAALAAALRADRLYGCALDVYDPEPPAADFPLLGLPRVLLTPHIAARTHTAMANMSWVVRDVIAVLEGRPPKCPAPAPQ
jgi:phosphoglycerate dehydrogenase-like enzyme